MENPINLQDPKTVNDHLAKNRKVVKPDYRIEYKGDRNIRPLQVGKREDFIQGEKIVRAEKMIINLQKKIVRTAVSFLFGVPPDITANDSDDELGTLVLDNLKKNRLNNKLLKFSEVVMSETFAAIIFSISGEVDKEVKFRVYSTNNGIFTPHFDPYGDLIAFYWEFLIGEERNLWVFDNTQIHKFKGEGEYNYIESEDHGFSVIPVVYGEQEEPEWSDVKEMIDRLEMIISKLSGSNNFFAFPILKLIGAIDPNTKQPLIDVAKDGKSINLGYAIKEGQVIQSNAEFLKRDSSIESIKAEVEFLKEFIHSISQTPDLSFDNVKGIGAVSGVALELMFMDAINKTVFKRAEYSTAIERVLSVVRSGVEGITGKTSEELDFDIEFNLSLPKDLSEIVKMLTEATAGKPIISQKTAVKISPLTIDVNEELDAIEEEENKRANGGESFNLPNA
jgi:hypothetical protein